MPTPTEVTELLGEGREIMLQIETWLNRVRETPGTDPYWVLTGETDIMRGFMGVKRAIERPEVI